MEFYKLYEHKIKECDQVIEELPTKFAPKREVSETEQKQLNASIKRRDKHAPSFNISKLAFNYFNTNLFAINGIRYNTVLCLSTNMGYNLNKFPTAKTFALIVKRYMAIPGLPWSCIKRRLEYPGQGLPGSGEKQS